MKKTEFYVNPLTYIPGGLMIKLEYADGSSSKGVNIKSAKRYIETVIQECLERGNELKRVSITSNGQVIYENGRWCGVNDNKLPF